MEFLKAQITRIQAQLNGLSASQKMLTVSLVVIMVMTMLFWSRYAGEPDMEPILNQSMSADEISQIVGTLKSQGIAYSVSGDRVLVPADRKMDVLAELGFAGSLPRNFDTAFDEMLSKSNMFDSPDKSDRMWLEARQRTLSQLISSFPNVAVADVVIDATRERRLTGNDIEPSATIMIKTRGGENNFKKLATSAAAIVCGAQAGLTQGRIKVVIDGTSVPLKDPSNGQAFTGDDAIEAQRQVEIYYRDKINDHFGYINGLMASVTVKLNTASSTTYDHSVDPKVTVSLPTSSNEQTTESTSGGGGGEPGAVPNVGVAINQGGGGGQNSNTSDSKTEFQNDYSKKEQWTTQGAGDATVIAATVRAPRSYFVAAYKNQTGKEADEAALGTFMTDELAQMKKEVKACTGLASDDAIVVGAYNDPAPIEAASTLSTPSTFTTALTGHVKEIGVGILAALSLFMVSMIVRKGGTMPVLATGGGGFGGAGAMQMPLGALGENLQSLAGGDNVVGQVSESGSNLDGMELDPEAVKAKQMLEQVQQMVQANPDAAANLVKRWLNRA